MNKFITSIMSRMYMNCKLPYIDIMREQFYEFLNHYYNVEVIENDINNQIYKFSTSNKNETVYLKFILNERGFVKEIECTKHI